MDRNKKLVVRLDIPTMLALVAMGLILAIVYFTPSEMQRCRPGEDAGHHIACVR